MEAGQAGLSPCGSWQSLFDKSSNLSALVTFPWIQTATRDRCLNLPFYHNAGGSCHYADISLLNHPHLQWDPCSTEEERGSEVKAMYNIFYEPFLTYSYGRGYMKLL